MPSAARAPRIPAGIATAATIGARHAAPMVRGAIMSHAIEIVIATGIETTAIGRPSEPRSAGLNRQRHVATSQYRIPQRHRALRPRQTASLGPSRASAGNRVVVGAAAAAAVAEVVAAVPHAT
jgi:hypothetical protein